MHPPKFDRRHALYAGIRRTDGTITVQVDGVTLSPVASQKIRNHSPDGFEWGYGGSGPAQLALALLLHATGDKETAERFYQEFKADVVAGWAHGGWAFSGEQVAVWLDRRRAVA